MVSNALRERLTYIVMSVFVVWHSLAIVIGPAPESSVTVQGLRVLLRPYLTLLRLDNAWDFFSPTVSSMRMSQFRYVIEDEVGNEFTFMPDAEFGAFNPAYFWFRDWHDAISTILKTMPTLPPRSTAEGTLRSTRYQSPSWRLKERTLHEPISWPASGAGSRICYSEHHLARPMPRRITFARLVREWFAALGKTWSQIWFQDRCETRYRLHRQLLPPQPRRHGNLTELLP